MTNTPMPGSSLPAPVTAGLQSLIPSVVRTLVPVILGLFVRIGFADTSIDNLWLERVLTIVVTMAYYVVVRVAEEHWEQIGWLLGYAKKPVYVKGTIVSATQESTPPTTTTVIETDEDQGPAD